MNLTTLYTHLRTVLLAQLEPGVDVVRLNNPAVAGTTRGPAVTLTHILDHPNGMARRLSKWDEPSGQMIHTESQTWEVTVQIGAVAVETVNNAPGPLARDYVVEAARILQSDAGRLALRDLGVASLKMGDVRSFQFKNDAEAYEDVPSFDIVMIYRHVSTSIAPVVETFEPHIG